MGEEGGKNGSATHIYINFNISFWEILYNLTSLGLNRLFRKPHEKEKCLFAELLTTRRHLKLDNETQLDTSFT